MRVTPRILLNVAGLLATGVFYQLWLLRSLQVDKEQEAIGAIHSFPSITTPGADDVKPTLILHVGPKKTGTTTIQEGLLGTWKYARALRNDGFVNIPFNYPFVESVVLNCLKAGDCNKTSWQDLTNQYTDAIAKREQQGGTARVVVHSNEAFSMIPRDDKATYERFAQLQEDWNVKVVVVYRRLDEWLPSLYAENSKRKVFNRRAKVPATWLTAQIDDPVQTFPQFFEEDFYNDPTDPLATMERFQEIFRKDNVMILDLSSPNGLEVEFACRGLPLAKRTCQVARHRHAEAIANNITSVRNPTAGQFQFDHDILVVEAGFKQWLFKKRILGRHDAKTQLQERLEAWNMSIHDLPQTCLSQQQQDWLWNRTLFSERAMAEKPMQESELRERFLGNRRKFCSIDAPKVLKNETWKGFFQNLTP